MKVRNYRNIIKGVKKAWPYVKVAYKGYKAYKSYNRSVANKKASYARGGGVTNQYDRERQYRRRRAPKRVRLRARKKFKMYRAQLIKSLGSRTAFMNEAITSTGVGGNQLWDSFILNGFLCTDATQNAYGFRDWNYICGRDYLIADTAGDAQSRWSGGSRKFIVDTSILDLTIHNSSYDAAIGVESRVPVELDLYEFTCGKIKWDRQDLSLTSAIDTIQSTWVKQQGDPTQIFTLLTNFRGITPFEFGKALQQLGIKITKKTKFFVPPGSTVTHQIRDSKNHVFDYIDITGESMMYPPGARGLFVISKVVVGSADTSLSGVPRLDYGVTRKYKYKVLESNGEKGAWYRDVA